MGNIIADHVTIANNNCFENIVGKTQNSNSDGVKSSLNGGEGESNRISASATIHPSADILSFSIFPWNMKDDKRAQAKCN